MAQALAIRGGVIVLYAHLVKGFAAWALGIGAHDASWGPIGRSYYARAVAAGDKQVRIVDAPESGHFEMISPATTTWPIVVEALHPHFARTGR